MSLTAVLCALAFGVTACGSDDNSSSDSGSSSTASTTASTTSTSGDTGGSTAVEPATDEQIQALMDDAFGGGVTVKDLPPLAQEAYGIMAKPVTADEIAKIKECLGQAKCDLGKPDATLDVAESEDINNPYHSSLRAIYILMSIREPAVKSISFTQANFDVKAALSNFRSHISQGADVIVGTFDLGPVMLPVIKQAAAKDITVWANTQGPDSKFDGSDLAGFTHVDLCQYGKDLVALAVKEGGKNIAMYSGPEGNAYAAQWQPCAEDEIKSEGANLVVKGATNWTPQGEAQAAAALAAKGLPDALIYDYTPVAFFDKFIKLGLTPPTQIGGSQTMGAYKAWADAQGTKHEFKSFIAASQITLGAVTLHGAVKAKSGETVEPDVVLPEPIIPVADVKPYYNPKFPAGANFGMGLPEEVLLPAFEAAG
ncbi:MAG: substrate-binding domain-containing protein [Solirubrobacteraceae bacterium]